MIEGQGPSNRCGSMGREGWQGEGVAGSQPNLRLVGFIRGMERSQWSARSDIARKSEESKRPLLLELLFSTGIRGYFWFDIQKVIIYNSNSSR